MLLYKTLLLMTFGTTLVHGVKPQNAVIFVTLTVDSDVHTNNLFRKQCP